MKINSTTKVVKTETTYTLEDLTATQLLIILATVGRVHNSPDQGDLYNTIYSTINKKLKYGISLSGLTDAGESISLSQQFKETLKKLEDAQ